jgi:hypothetical protein
VRAPGTGAAQPPTGMIGVTALLTFVAPARRAFVKAV